VAKDSSIWFATSNGILSFNGKKWQRYTNADGLQLDVSISDIAIDSKGNKWLACRGGVGMFDGERCTMFDSLNHQAILAGYSIAVDGADRIWCSSALFPIGVFDGKNWTPYQSPLWTTERGIMSDVAVSPQGKVWAVYSGGGLFTLEDAGWYRVVIPGGIVANYANSLFFDPMGKLWIAHNLGVSSFQNNTWEHYTCMPESFPAGEVRCKIDNGCNYIGYVNALKDADGRLWFGGNSNGLTMFDGTTWKRFDSTNGLSSSMVTSLAQDSAKMIWVSTIRGAVKIDPGKLTDSRNPQRAVMPDRPAITVVQRNSRITISLTSMRENAARLQLFSMDGRLCFSHQAVFNKSVYVSPRIVHGTYIARVSLQNTTISRRIMVVD
jgi:hypothetical protein